MTGVGPLDGIRALVADGTTTLGQAVVARLRKQGADVAALNRFRNEDAVQLGEVALAELGGLDALVVPCGQAPQMPLSATPDSVWDEVLESHLLDPWLLIRVCAPALRRSGGAIVVIASATHDWPSARAGAHSVAAHALVSLSRMLAVELAPSGVRVNTVCPEPYGPTSNDHGAADDAASTIAFLLSADARACNATTLVLDGGARASLRAGLAVAT